MASGRKPARRRASAMSQNRKTILGPLVDRRTSERRPGATDRRALERGGRRAGDAQPALKLETVEEGGAISPSSVVRTGRRTGDVISITLGPEPSRRR